MVSEFVYRDHSRNDASALHSYTRVSCVDGTSKINFRCNEMEVIFGVNIFGVMKWKSTVESSGLLGAQWLISRSSLALILQNAFEPCALDARY